MVVQRAPTGDGLGKHRNRSIGQLILVDIVTGQCRRSVLGDGLVIDTDHTGIARHQHSRSGKRLQYADCNRVRSHDERIRHVISMIASGMSSR